jgi:hypothetical protein
MPIVSENLDYKNENIEFLKEEIPEDILDELGLNPIGKGQNELTTSYETTKIPFGGFIQNLGQIGDDIIEFFYSSDSSTIGFSESSVLVMSHSEEIGKTLLTLSFPNSNNVHPIGLNQKEHSINYFYGDLKLTNVHSFDEIWFYNLYDGIDLRYYMSSKGLKYEFIVHPGANPSGISIQADNTMEISVQEKSVSFTHKQFQNKIMYMDNNLRVFQKEYVEIDARFYRCTNLDNAYGFDIGQYDDKNELIIDPLFLLNHSTYLGGDYDDRADAIAVDSSGYIYTTGRTYSDDFPIESAYQETKDTYWDVFITKIAPNFSKLIYSTYVGGDDYDYGIGIAVNTLGEVYVAGHTYSTDFPLKNAYQTEFHGSIIITDGFLLKLNSAGDDLIYSTYLGGSSNEYVTGIGIDTSGNCTVGGYTYSTDFPTWNAYSSTSGGGIDAFVVKFNSSGNGLVYSTYLGGGDNDNAYGLSIDGSSNAYITGETDSDDFPTANAYNDTYSGNWDIFITKLNASGGLNFSTYLGSTGRDEGYGIAVDTNDDVYVTGLTDSLAFPTKSAYSNSLTGEEDIFITKLNRTGNGIIYSTFLGGSGDDSGRAIVVDGIGDVYITGMTKSSDFPMWRSYNETFGGDRDSFILKINSTGSGVNFSSYIGGSDYEIGRGIAIAPSGAVYITGDTESDNFPFLNGYDENYGGYGDAFVSVYTPTGSTLNVYLNSPKNNSVVTSEDIVNLTIEDSTLAIDCVTYTWDDSNNISLNHPYDIIIPVGDGSRILKIYANNSHGKWATKTYKFIVDDTEPFIELDTPTNYTSHLSGTWINLTVTDLHLDTVLYSWDEASENQTLETPYSIQLLNGHGEHILRIYVNDSAGNWDYSLFLFTTIDNMFLFQSTYYGGSAKDYPTAIAIDDEGNLYLTGYTESPDFPIKDAYNGTYSETRDVFIVKINSTGNGVVYSTYIGGIFGDEGKDIAVDMLGNCYVIGYTESENFPMSNAFNDTFGGDSDGFILKLNPLGNNLVFSSFLGGADSDLPESLAIDSELNCYITGTTWSSDFPLKNALFDELNGSSDAFILKLNSSGENLVFSTYIGASDYDYSYGLEIDSNYCIYICGETLSDDFPLKNAYQTEYKGGYDVFILKLNATGNEIIYSTYLSGTNEEWLGGLDVDSDGYCYVCGSTMSSDFPVINAIQSELGGTTNGFITKLNPDGTTANFSTFLGGSNQDSISDILVDESRQLHLVGISRSVDFPVFSSYMMTNPSLGSSAFVTRINSTGTGLIFSSYLGGSMADRGYGLALDNNGLDILLGETYSEDFPTYNALNDTNNGDDDIFITRLGPDLGSPIIQLDNPSEYSVQQPGTSVNFTIYDELTEISHVLVNWDGFPNETIAAPYAASIPEWDGIHSLYVYVNDTLNNWESDVFNFVIDGTTPDVALVQLENNTVHQTDTLIEVSVTDSHLDSVLYRWDNPDANQTWDAPYETLLPSGDGQHFLFIFSNDTAGNSIVMTFSFTTDDSSPEIILEAPANNTLHLSGTILNYTISELHLEYVLYRWNNQIEDQTLPSPYDIPIPSPDGWHSIYLFANDSAGNWINSSFTFETDDTPPDIESPDDIDFNEGESGYHINWSAYDLHPERYRILLNGTEIKNGTWISDDWYVLVHVDSLTLGIYNYTIVFNDTLGTANYDMVLVTVSDATPPSINQPLDLNYIEGTFGNVIEWSPSDSHPSSYEIIRNGTVIRSGSWKGGDIWIPVDGLPAGTHNYTLLVYDSSGNTAFDSVFVVVRDLTSPLVNHPPNLEFTEGTTGHTITWSCIENNPAAYEIYQNDSLIESDEWEGLDIIVSVDGLTPSTYNYTLIVFDTSKNIGNDSVLITVIAAPIVTITTTSPTVTTTTPTITSQPITEYIQELFGPMTALIAIVGGIAAISIILSFVTLRTVLVKAPKGSD